MRIGIVGSTSLVGRAIARQAVDIGWEPLLIGRQDADVIWDVTQEMDQLPSVRLDAVVNASAFFGAEPAHARAVNFQGAMNAMRLAAQLGARHYVYVSTISVLNKADTHAYAQSKRDAELDFASMGYMFENTSICVVRPSQLVETEGLARKHQPAFYNIIDGAISKKPMILYGSRDPIRNFLHIDDLSACIINQISRRTSGVLNVVNPQRQTLGDVMRLASQCAGAPSDPLFDPSRPDIPDIYVPNDGSELETWTDTTPLDLRCIIQKVIEQRMKSAW